ncbi:hypothetical protein FBU30_000067 [Linnemannia zychae]|nr:hypothetical protein FBU30_000067 [Linnemannia zychae]
MTEATATLITERTRQQFYRDGFIVIPNALGNDDVEILRREADTLINYLISENVNIMTDYGGIIEPITCGYIDPPMSQMFILSKKSYSHVRDQVPEDPDTVTEILFEKVPAFANHFLPPETEDKPTCLDSQYMDADAQEKSVIVSCWIALDDVNMTNGTLLVEPFPRPKDAQTGDYCDLPSNFQDYESYLQYHKDIASHYVNPPANKMTAIMSAQNRPPLTLPPSSEHSISTVSGTSANAPRTWIYESQAPVLVEVPAGSIVFLSGWVRHCSLGNSSYRFRRAFMPQYSAGKVVTETGGLVSLAVPCRDYEVEREVLVLQDQMQNIEESELFEEEEEFNRDNGLNFEEDIESVDMDDGE